MRYEYKVIPAPSRGQKGKGVKGADGRFANALEQAMNQLGAAGWEYLRADTLPSDERAGLTSKTTVFRSVLVFRRPSETDVSAFDPKLLEAPAITGATEPQEPEPGETLDPAADSASETERETEAEDTSSQHSATYAPDDEDDAEHRTASDLSGPARARAQQLSKSTET